MNQRLLPDPAIKGLPEKVRDTTLSSVAKSVRMTEVQHIRVLFHYDLCESH